MLQSYGVAMTKDDGCNTCGQVMLHFLGGDQSKYDEMLVELRLWFRTIRVLSVLGDRLIDLPLSRSEGCKLVAELVTGRPVDLEYYKAARDVQTKIIRPIQV